MERKQNIIGLCLCHTRTTNIKSKIESSGKQVNDHDK